MQPDVFERVLFNGLGRAVLYLQRHDASPYQDILAHACTHNISFDPQSEGTKVTYLFDIIETVGNFDFYRRHILAAANHLSKTTPKWDANHLMNMLIFLAFHHEDHEARSLLYELFGRDAMPDPIWWAMRLIELDGPFAFSFVARKITERLVLDTEGYHKGSNLLTGALEEYLGKEHAARWLTREQRENPDVEALLKWIEEGEKKKRSNRRKLFTLPYEKLKPYLEDDEAHRSLRGWGIRANPDDLLRAARDLQKQEQVSRIKKYLELFHWSAYPLDPGSILALTSHQDETVRCRARQVLKNTTHSKVRRYAFDMLETAQNTGHAIAALAHNYQPGDWKLILPFVQAHPITDRDELHQIQMAVNTLFDHNPSPNAEEVLLHLYEFGTCSFCRESTVEDLHAIGALTAQLRAECAWDSNLDIRTWVDEINPPRDTASSEKSS